MTTLDGFIASARNPGFPRNAWVEEKDFDCLYVRFTKRAIEGAMLTPVLDLASFEVKEELRGTGAFTRFIKKLREAHPDLHLYVENTHDRFCQYLMKKGFIQIKNGYEHICANLILLAGAPFDAASSIEKTV